MAPTMKDVAALAGVSPKTVSRVVNDAPHISDAVRHRVEAAIDRLGWRPNPHARSLRTGRTGLLALALPDLRDPVSSRFAQAFVMEADRRGLLVALEPTRGEGARLARTLAALGPRFDGVVVGGPLPAGALPGGGAPDLPVVLVGDGGTRPAVTVPGPAAAAGHPPRAVDVVSGDAGSAAAAVHRHLRTLGRSRPVVVSLDAPGTPHGFSRELAVRVPAARVLPAGPLDRRRAGAGIAERALTTFPDLDALVCGDDDLALGALSALVRRGVGVPDDVAVTGWSALDDGRYTVPSLTTVDPDLQEMARTAVDLCLARLAGDRRPPRHVAVPSVLLRRESTLGAEAPSTATRGTRAAWPG